MSGVFLGQLFRVGTVAAILVGAGLVLALLAPHRWRPLLVPAAPVVGAALAVGYINWTGLVVGFSGAGPVFAVAAIAGLVWIVLRRRERLTDARGLLISMVILLASGIPGMAINLSATSDVDSTGLRFPSPGSDGFYFASVDDWLMDHTVWDVPDRSSSATSPDSPANDPARQYQLGARRWGEAGIQGLASSIFRNQSSDQWIPMTSLWLLFIAPGAYVLALGLGSSARRARRAGVIAGLAVGGLGAMSYLLLNQNSMFALGIGLGLFATGSLLFALRQDEPVSWWDSFPAAVGLIGLLGTSFEYSIVLAPVIVAGTLPTLVRHRERWRRLLSIAVVTAVVGPLATFNAVRGLLFLSGVSSNWPDTYQFGPILERLGRILGTFPVDAFGVPANIARGPTTLALAILWIGGLALALRSTASRWPLISLIATTTGYWWFQVGGSQNYVPNRVVAMAVPTGMVVICIGVSESIPLLAGSRSRRLVVVGAALTSVLALSASAMTTHDTVRRFEPTRRVGIDDTEAVGWVRTFGGNAGANVLIVTPELHSQFFLMDRTSDLRDVGWLQLHPAYARRLVFEPIAPASYALVDQTAVMFGTTNVVRQNRSWRLMDIRRGGVVLPSGRVQRVPTTDGFDIWSSADPIDVPIAVGPGCASVGVQIRNPVGQPLISVHVGTTANGPFQTTDLVAGSDTSSFDLPVSAGGLSFVRLGGTGDSGAEAANGGRTLAEERAGTNGVVVGSDGGFRADVRFVPGPGCQ